MSVHEFGIALFSTYNVVSMFSSLLITMINFQNDILNTFFWEGWGCRGRRRGGGGWLQKPNRLYSRDQKDLDLMSKQSVGWDTEISMLGNILAGVTTSGLANITWTLEWCFYPLISSENVKTTSCWKQASKIMKRSAAMSKNMDLRIKSSYRETKLTIHVRTFK